MELASKEMRHEDAKQDQVVKPILEDIPAKADKADKAEQNVISRVAAEDKKEDIQWPNAGEKVGDTGATKAEIMAKIDGRDVVIPKGTGVTVKEVLGDKLVVTTSAGKTFTIATDLFAKGRTPEPIDPRLDPTVNPTPQNEYAKSAAYAEVKGTVAVKGEGDAHAIDPNDVEQGSLGDCYLVAQLAAMAKSNPQAVQDLIQDNGDGTYVVTLYLRDGWKRKATKIVVDNRFPMEGGSVAYAKPGDAGSQGPELWVMLFEKAWAKYSGAYDNIQGHKTKDGDVMGMVTGVDSDYQNLSSMDDERLVKLCTEALTAGKGVFFSSKAPESLDEDEKKEQKKAGVVGNHAYTLMTVDGKAKTLTLRNPWAVQHVENAPAATIRRFYRSIHISGK